VGGFMKKRQPAGRSQFRGEWKKSGAISLSTYPARPQPILVTSKRRSGRDWANLLNSSTYFLISESGRVRMFSSLVGIP
jgi:hypothetical protein